MIELKGYFFLPDKVGNEDYHIPGILKISEKGNIRLELYHSLSKKKSFFLHLHEKQNITVWGVLENSKKVSLFKCFVSKTNQHFESVISNISYFVNYALQGIHQLDVSTACVDQVYAEIEGLETWLNISGGKVKKIDMEVSRTFEYSYKLPEPIKININEEVEFSFGFIVNIDPQNYGLITIQKSVIEINTTEQFPIYRLRDIIWKFIWFLTMISNKRIGYKSIIMSSSEDKVYYEKIDPQRNHYNFYMRRDDYPFTQKIYPHSFLINFKEVSGEIELILKKWYELFEKGYKHIIDLVIEKIQQSEVFTIQYFLSLTQALEGIHRLKSAKKEHFVTRLRSVFHENRKSVLTTYSDEDIEQILKEIKSLRNSYTHIEIITDKNDKSKLIYLSTIMLHELRVSLLKEIGVSEDLINKKVIENDLYTYKNIQ